MLTGEGTINKRSFANAALIFEQNNELTGVFRYNTLARKTFIHKNLPWENIKKPRPLSDIDETNAVIWLEREHGISCGVNAMHGILQATGDKHKYNPVTDYLDGLRWDGIERLPNMLTDLMGVENTSYTQSVGKRFMIGATARAYKPGCKMDNILVFEGKQGRHQKSTFVEKLFGAEFFGDSITDIGSKDTMMLITQKWCFEIPELDALEKKNSSEIKAWLTRKYEEFREPYGRNIVQVPRPCVFIGTTNEESYLKDATGGRRFWPVLCREFGHEKLIEIRDQLWAEASHFYKQGERWWLKDSEIDDAEVEQEARQSVDIWENKISDFIQNQSEVLIDDILQTCLCVGIEKWNRPMEMRIGYMLKKWGWKRFRTTVHGKRKWVYRLEKQDELELGV